MSHIKLFTDGSVDPKSNIGYGAYLIVNTQVSLVASPIKVKQFIDTSSTKLELETLLWALEEIKDKECRIVIYTDSQNIIGLARRREHFEKNNFLTKKNKLIGNYLLYQAFYKIIDQLDCSLVKVEGHKPLHDKDAIDALFTLVDRASRTALREGLFS